MVGDAAVNAQWMPSNGTGQNLIQQDEFLYGLIRGPHNPIGCCTSRPTSETEIGCDDCLVTMIASGAATWWENTNKNLLIVEGRPNNSVGPKVASIYVACFQPVADMDLTDMLNGRYGHYCLWPIIYDLSCGRYGRVRCGLWRYRCHSFGYSSFSTTNTTSFFSFFIFSLFSSSPPLLLLFPPPPLVRRRCWSPSTPVSPRGQRLDPQSTWWMQVIYTRWPPTTSSSNLPMILISS